MNTKRISVHSFLLGIILLLGAVLRFYRYTDIPFSNDELSALFRLRYNSFSELIRLVKDLDTHPALVQVFLNYYCQLFGTTEWVVKLPFTICAMLVIVLIYRTGSLIGNKNLGLLCAAFVATSQYFIFYSQMARPYMPGLLFILMAVHAGLKIILFEKQPNWQYCLLGISFYLAAITHYFDLMAAGLWAILLLLLEKKGERKKLLYTYAILLLAYSPHLNILYAHLKTGGIGGAGGWLGKPDPSFFMKYAGYVLQYNEVSYLLALSSVCFSLYFLFRAPVREIRLLLGGFAVFLICLLTGYFYSVYRNPVLQYSVLLFSFIFTLPLLFYGVSRLRRRYAFLFLGLLTASGIHGLVNEREHFRVFYHHGYQASVQSLLPYHNAEIIINGIHPSYFEYYFNKYQYHQPYRFFRGHELPYTAFIEWIRSCRHDTLILTSGMPLDLTYAGIARTYYPNLVQSETGSLYETFVFSRDTLASGQNHFKEMPDSFNEKAAFGPTATYELNGANDNNLNIEVSCLIDASGPVNPVLVMVVEDEQGKQLAWLGMDYTSQFVPGTSPTPLVMVKRLYEIAGNQQVRLKAYVWNRGKERFTASKPVFRITDGNRLIYSLIEDFR